MADFADIDQQLAALGAAPEDARALLERVLGSDRSRERLDGLLAELSQAWTPAPVPPPPRRRPSSHPPRALGRHHVRFDPMSAARLGTRPSGKRSTLIGLPSSAPPEPSGIGAANFGAHAGGRGAEQSGAGAARVAAEADTDLHSLAPQPESWSIPDTDPGAELAPERGFSAASSASSEAFDRAADADSVRDSSIRPPSPAGIETPPGASEAAPDPEQAALDERERKRESQRVMRALLEQDLDPKDFADPPAPAEAAADNDLEVVVEEEEEEILELDDIELLEDDE